MGQGHGSPALRWPPGTVRCARAPVPVQPPHNTGASPGTAGPPPGAWRRVRAGGSPRVRGGDARAPPARPRDVSPARVRPLRSAALCGRGPWLRAGSCCCCCRCCAVSAGRCAAGRAGGGGSPGGPRPAARCLLWSCSWPRRLLLFISRLPSQAAPSRSHGPGRAGAARGGAGREGGPACGASPPRGLRQGRRGAQVPGAG